MQQRLRLIQVPTLLHLTRALEASMVASSLAKLGELHYDWTLMYERLKVYRRALHQLQLALWDPELVPDDQNLTACIALDELMSNSIQAWLHQSYPGLSENYPASW